MSNAIEIEAKAMVGKDEYERLVRLFPSCPRYLQTNYYIDTDNRDLAKSGIALRIREKAGMFEFTLKTPLSQGKLEKSEPISFNDFAAFRDFGVFPKNDLHRFLLMLDFKIEDLKILASLSTERLDIEYEGGKISVDKNTYSGNTDYEVEFEYNNLAGAEKILFAFLDENKIAYTPTDISKHQRALKAAGK